MNKYKCINDVFSTRQKEIFKTLPIKGQEYTLSSIVNSPIDNKEGYIFLELPNPSHPNGQEFSFRPSRFVPLEKLTIDSLINEREHAL